MKVQFCCLSFGVMDSAFFEMQFEQLVQTTYALEHLEDEENQ